MNSFPKSDNNQKHPNVASADPIAKKNICNPQEKKEITATHDKKSKISQQYVELTYPIPLEYYLKCEAKIAELRANKIFYILPFQLIITYLDSPSFARLRRTNKSKQEFWFSPKFLFAFLLRVLSYPVAYHQLVKAIGQNYCELIEKKSEIKIGQLALYEAAADGFVHAKSSNVERLNKFLLDIYTKQNTTQTTGCLELLQCVQSAIASKQGDRFPQTLAEAVKGGLFLVSSTTKSANSQTLGCSCIIRSNSENLLPDERKRDKTAIYLEEKDDDNIIVHWMGVYKWASHPIEPIKVSQIKAYFKSSHIIKRENQPSFNDVTLLCGYTQILTGNQALNAHRIFASLQTIANQYSRSNLKKLQGAGATILDVLDRLTTRSGNSSTTPYIWPGL